MDFVFDLPVTAATTRAIPAELDVEIGAGVIILVEVEMPPGCGGEVYASVRQAVHQLYPSNPSGFYRSDARVYVAREHYLIKKGDAPLTIQGWSPDAAFDHVIQFRFVILPRAVVEPMVDLVALFKKFLKFIGAK